MTFFRNPFGSKARHAPPEEMGTEMANYSQINRTNGVGTEGSIDLLSHSSTSYSESASDLTVHTIESRMPGEGSRMMNMVSEEAASLGKSHVRTTLTAPSAHNFYLKMGLHPSANIKQARDHQFGSVQHFTTAPIPGRTNAEGHPMGQFTAASLDAFDTRLKLAKTNPVWEGETATVRTQSAAHWKR